MLRDELVHSRGRRQIDEPGQDVDEICLRIDPGQLAGSTSSTMWVSSPIPDAAIIKDACKLDSSPTPVGPEPPLHVGRLVAQGTRSPAADPHCATNVCGWLEYDYEDKVGTPRTTNPLGFPEQ